MLPQIEDMGLVMARVAERFAAAEAIAPKPNEGLAFNEFIVSPAATAAHRRFSAVREIYCTKANWCYLHGMRDAYAQIGGYRVAIEVFDNGEIVSFEIFDGWPEPACAHARSIIDALQSRQPNSTFTADVLELQNGEWRTVGILK